MNIFSQACERDSGTCSGCESASLLDVQITTPEQPDNINFDSINLNVSIFLGLKDLVISFSALVFFMVNFFAVATVNAD